MAVPLKCLFSLSERMAALPQRKPQDTLKISLKSPSPNNLQSTALGLRHEVIEGASFWSSPSRPAPGKAQGGSKGPSGAIQLRRQRKFANPSTTCKTSQLGLMQARGTLRGLLLGTRCAWCEVNPPACSGVYAAAWAKSQNCGDGSPCNTWRQASLAYNNSSLAVMEDINPELL